MSEAPEQPRDRLEGPTQNPSLLLLLNGNLTLQKLIATWPNAWRQSAKKQEQIATWAALTGLREVEVEDAWRTLFENGFVNRDGTVDELAARYVKSLAIAALPASVRGRRREDSDAPGRRESGQPE